MTTQPDFFPDIPRTLTRDEAAQAFDELLRTVARMTFAADEMRKKSSRVARTQINGLQSKQK